VSVAAPPRHRDRDRDRCTVHGERFLCVLTRSVTRYGGGEGYGLRPVAASGSALHVQPYMV